MRVPDSMLTEIKSQNARPLVTASSAPQAPNQHQFTQPPQQNQPGQQQRFAPQLPPGQGPPRFQQHNHFPQYYPPPNQRFGPPSGPPGGPAGGAPGYSPYGYPPMPYGSPPPGWFPPPGQGFPYPNPGNVYGPPGPFGPSGQMSVQQGPPSKPGDPAELSKDSPQGVIAEEGSNEKPTATVKLPSSSTTPAPPMVTQPGPPPPTESKPNIAEALAPPSSTAVQQTPATSAPAAATTVSIAPKSGRILPAIPLASPAAKPRLPVNGAPKSTVNHAQAAPSAAIPTPASQPAQTQKRSLEDTSRDARAAVQEAMAKLPPALAQPKKQVNSESSAFDNLTNKVNEMRTNDNIRTSKQPGTGGYAAGHRGGRGSHRNPRPREEQLTKKIDVPKTDYDFAEANAKFNRQDLVKEAIASGDSIISPIEGSDNASTEVPMNGARRTSEQSITIPAAPGYSKSSSFFDNISSEAKDRDDKKIGGREFRSEEQKRNLETFGQGSVDNGYRGGYRGGRGRGRGSFRGGSRGTTFGSRGGRGSSTRGHGAVTAEG